VIVSLDDYRFKSQIVSCHTYSNITVSIVRGFLGGCISCQMEILVGYNKFEVAST